MASVYASYPPTSGSGGGGGITSINGDTTAAQVIAAGSGISVSTVAGTTTITATGGGSGTVTSVSVTTANGVSGTVATATTTPAISLTLGAITPSSVAAVGTVTGSNLSGTNTGDQTITLTGDVTGSGTGSFAATIAAGAVTNAKIAAAAGISVNKLAALTASTAVASDASGFLVSSATTAAELGFVSGVTSAIQTQLNGKQASGNYITALTGDVTASGPGSVAATIANLAVTNAKIANSTIDLTAKVTGALPIGNGGTGQTTANPAFNALSPLTTKGDIVAFSTVNARLPVGTDGQVLMADSGQTLGLTWGTASSQLAGNLRASEGNGTTTLTNSDSRIQLFNLSGNQNCVLPTTGVLKGDIWWVATANTFILTVQASDASNILAINGRSFKVMARQNTPTTSSHWQILGIEDCYYPFWVDYTPTFSRSSIDAATKVRWRRVSGGSLELSGTIKYSGTVAGSNQQEMSLPSPYTIDTTTMFNGSASTYGTSLYFDSNAGNAYSGLVCIGNSSGTVSFWNAYNISDMSGSRVKLFQDGDGNANDTLSFTATIPIANWAES